MESKLCLHAAGSIYITSFKIITAFPKPHCNKPQPGCCVRGVSVRRPQVIISIDN